MTYLFFILASSCQRQISLPSLLWIVDRTTWDVITPASLFKLYSPGKA